MPTKYLAKISELKICRNMEVVVNMFLQLCNLIKKTKQKQKPNKQQEKKKILGM